MKKAFLLVFTVLVYFQTQAQYITYNGADISATTLITSKEELTPAIKKKLICIGAQIDWTSPLSETIRISVDPSIFGQEFNCQGEILVFEDIIDVNNGVIKKPGGADDDNYDYILNIDQPDSGTIGTGIPVLDDWKMALSINTVKVGIFDTGFNPNIENGTPSSTDSWDYVNNSDQVTADHYHGSHIASVAYGMIKDDPNEQNILYSNYKILNEMGHGLLSDIIIAAEEAIAYHDVDILNFSLSGLNTGDVSKYLENMILAAEQEDVLFVFSAGNDGIDLSNGQSTVIPAALQGPNVITVASGKVKNGNYKISLFSNYGYENVDILAPGENITGVDNYGEELTLSGTSQAAAIVSAVASMLGSYQDQFNGVHIKCALMEGATTISSLENILKSGGIIDTYSAHEQLQSSDPCDFEAEFLISKKKISIFPNPVKESLHLNLSEGYYQIEIFDALGTKVMSKSLNSDGSELQLYTAHLTSGLYHIMVHNNETYNSTSLKFIKN